MQEKAQEIAELSDRVKHIERVNRLLEEMMEEKDEAMIELDSKIEKLAADVGFMVHEQLKKFDHRCEQRKETAR